VWVTSRNGLESGSVSTVYVEGHAIKGMFSDYLATLARYSDDDTARLAKMDFNEHLRHTAWWGSMANMHHDFSQPLGYWRNREAEHEHSTQV